MSEVPDAAIEILPGQQRTFDDGYRMAAHADGTVTLTDPHGKRAKWSTYSQSWIGPDGNRMSDEWSGGKEPWSDHLVNPVLEP